MNFQGHLICWWLASLITVIGSDKAGSSAENILDSIPDLSEQEGTVDEEIKTEKQSDGYKSGSICVYCKYCQLCKICDAKCPCKTQDENEHCEMCKYCQYCYLCSTACETVCVPGGFLDVFTSAVYDSFTGNGTRLM